MVRWFRQLFGDKPSPTPAEPRRLPLSFPDFESFDAFRAGLANVFLLQSITDATVIQLGSPTAGWRTNPNLALEPWSKSCDVDLAIFSSQALTQAMKVNAMPVKRVQWRGKYVLLKNRAPGGRGYEDTELGRALRSLAREWSTKLFGGRDAVHFRLHLDSGPDPNTPFTDGIVVLKLAGN